jgi:PAS domain S-box-containing protein
MNSHIFIEYDSRNIIHTISPSCEKILGYKQKDLIGQDVKTLLNDSITSSSDEIIFKNKEQNLITAKRKMITNNLYVYSLC